LHHHLWFRRNGEHVHCPQPSAFAETRVQVRAEQRRCWLIKNDWVEAIVALPLNLFYNTGIATYIWVLSNKKPKARKGQIQLIDATQWYRPLRKNLGKKNCELAEEDIQRIMDTYIAFKPTEQSKIFPNAALGYWKVVVERPLRLKSQLTIPRIEALRYASGDEEIRSQLVDEFGDALFEDFGSVQKALAKRLAEWGSDDEEDEGAPAKSLPESKKKKLLSSETWQRDARLVSIATELRKEIGEPMFDDHNQFCEAVDAVIKKLELKISGAELKLVLRGVSWTDESAAPVIGLLEEQKQAIIHRAVTRGLDDTAPLKPSGLDWLGDVPERWEIGPMKRLLSRINHGTSQAGSESGCIRLLTMGNIQRGEVLLPETGAMNAVEKIFAFGRW
jgi:hypothetical protein